MAISLSKGQTISLKKETSGLAAVRMGLGWDAAKKKGFWKSIMGGDAPSVDLDASCILFDEQKDEVDIVWFRQLASNDGSIQHSGDNRTGDGDGDDESIVVNLRTLPARVRHLVFTVNSFTGQSFNEVDNAVCRLLDHANGREIVRFELAEKGAHTGVVMAVLSRTDSMWTMKAVGSIANGRTVRDLIQVATAAI